jgi:hypothetical protein
MELNEKKPREKSRRPFPSSSFCSSSSSSSSSSCNEKERREQPRKGNDDDDGGGGRNSDATEGLGHYSNIIFWQKEARHMSNVAVTVCEERRANGKEGLLLR